MNQRTRKACLYGLILAFATALVLPGTVAAEPTESWTQWGGNHQDFKATSKGLASEWPKAGPHQIWSRDLGDGYSTILVEDGKLYTMYRDAEAGDEVVIALDAATGKTIWEHRYDQDPAEGHVSQFGTGPRATPLIVDDRIYTIGIAGMMHSLDKNDGSVKWSHDLWGEEFGGYFLNHGYSSSPIEYGDTIITLVGGEGKSIVAFNKEDGSTAWANMSYKNSYSTPQVLEIDGQEQLLAFMAEELIGADPKTGEELWRYPVENQWGQNINLPALVDGQYLFLSTTQAGSRGLKLTNTDGKTNVEELWSSRKIQFYHATTVREGDYVYGSSGSRSPAFMSAINIKTGEIPWRQRGFAKANSVGADGKIIVLDEDGKMFLTTATPEKLTIHSEAQLLDRVAWTAPTIVGSNMYVRDKNRIMALDLSTTANAEAIAAEKKAMGESEAVAKKTEEAAETKPAVIAESADDPEAIKILKRADKAVKAVKGVRYKGSAKPSGVATNFVSASEGWGIMHGWTGRTPEKFFAHVKSTRPGTDEPMEVSGGSDGETYFLIDHGNKKAYEDMDPGVMGSGGQMMGAISLPEFVRADPFDDEISAKKVELLGKKDVAGVECYEISVEYDRGKSTWYFSTEDYLPRRRTRYFSVPNQGEGSLEITVSDLELNPEVDASMFQLDLPEGFEKVDDFAP